MKVCTVCQQEKALERFSPNAGCVGGRSTQCKDCQAARKRAARLANPDAVRAQERASIEKRREAKRGACREWYVRNREARLATEKARYARDSDRIKTVNQEYRRNNKEKVYAWNGTRRAVLRNACPPWVDKDQISAFYDLAADLTSETGVRYHVDHVIPLAGKTVCGLHVPANLQVIPAAANLAKGARWI